MTLSACNSLSKINKNDIQLKTKQGTNVKNSSQVLALYQQFQTSTAIFLQTLLTNTVLPLLTKTANNYLTANPLEYCKGFLQIPVIGSLTVCVYAQALDNNLLNAKLLNWNLSFIAAKSASVSTYVIYAFVYWPNMSVSVYHQVKSSGIAAGVGIIDPSCSQGPGCVDIPNVLLSIAFQVDVTISQAPMAANFQLSNWKIIYYKIITGDVNVPITATVFSAPVYSTNIDITSALYNALNGSAYNEIVSLGPLIPPVSYSMPLGIIPPSVAVPIIVQLLQMQINLNPVANTTIINAGLAYRGTSFENDSVACFSSCTPANGCANYLFNNGSSSGAEPGLCLTYGYFYTSDTDPSLSGSIILPQFMPMSESNAMSNWFLMSPGFVPFDINTPFTVTWAPQVLLNCFYDADNQYLLSAVTQSPNKYYATVCQSSNGTAIMSFLPSPDPVYSSGFIILSDNSKTEPQLISNTGPFSPVNCSIVYYSVLTGLFYLICPNPNTWDPVNGSFFLCTTNSNNLSFNAQLVSTASSASSTSTATAATSAINIKNKWQLGLQKLLSRHKNKAKLALL